MIFGKLVTATVPLEQFKFTGLSHKWSNFMDFVVVVVVVVVARHLL